MAKQQDQDHYRGSALAQIVKHPTFKAINEPPDARNGHYLVNQNIHIFVKYSKKKKSDWSFNFPKPERDDIEVTSSENPVFVVFVCGRETIGALTADEFHELVDPGEPRQQVVVVSAPARAQLRFRHKRKEFPRRIPNGRFPGLLFE